MLGRPITLRAEAGANLGADVLVSEYPGIPQVGSVCGGGG
jgi:hypothetical protein